MNEQVLDLYYLCVEQMYSARQFTPEGKQSSEVHHVYLYHTERQ